MTLYHGGVCEIRIPKLSFAKHRLDFGRAFYLTSYKHQAEKWAKRKAVRTRGAPIVNVYRLADDLSKFKVRDFKSANGDWLDFVCACRSGRSVGRKVDIIKGMVANDDVFKTVDAYLKGDMTRAATLKELRYLKPNDQIALASVKAIRALEFQRSYVVKGD